MFSALIKNNFSSNKPCTSILIAVLFSLSANADDTGIAATSSLVTNDVTDYISAPAELQNRIAIIDLLLAKGADLNARDELERTPLHISMPIYELAQHLLSKGAKADTKNVNQESPFISAEYVDQVKRLIDAGIDVTIKDYQRRVARPL